MTFDRLPIRWIECPKKYSTYIHKDATRWYCVGCRIVHLIESKP